MSFDISTPAPYYYHIGDCYAEKPAQDLHKEVYQFYEETDSHNNYQLSIPLLLGAQLEDVKLYEEVLQKMYPLFGLSKDSDVQEIATIVETWGKKASFHLWLIGRILVAADRIQDEKTAHQMSLFMEIALEEQPINPFSTWAWGYLAVYHATDEEKYPHYREKMMTALELLQQQEREQVGQDHLWRQDSRRFL